MKIDIPAVSREELGSVGTSWATAALGNMAEETMLAFKLAGLLLWFYTEG